MRDLGDRAHVVAMARPERHGRAAHERRPLVDGVGKALQRDAAVGLGPNVDDLGAAQLLGVRDLAHGRELVLADHDPVALTREVERGDERAHSLRNRGRDGDVVGLRVQQPGERGSRRLVPLDPELPLRAVLVPAGQPLLRCRADAVRKRTLRARVRVRRVLEDRELVPNGQSRGQVRGQVRGRVGFGPVHAHAELTQRPPALASRAVKISVRLVQYLGSPREIVDLAVAAERAGVDEVWVPHDPFMSNALTMQTAIAERTERVVVGTLGTNPYTTDPSEIATHLATLDLLSGGRAALGLGLHTTAMVEWLGLDATDVVERTRAAVAIVRALLRGETVTSEGPYAWGDECSLRFEPLRPDPPIHVAGFGSELLRLAGEIGDGAMPMATPPESVEPLLADIRAGAAGGRAQSGRARARGVRLALALGGRSGDGGAAATDDRDLRPAPRGARARVDRAHASRARAASHSRRKRPARRGRSGRHVTDVRARPRRNTRAGRASNRGSRRTGRDPCEPRRAARPRSARGDPPPRRTRPPGPRTSARGTPCGDPRSRSAPTPSPRGRSGRSTARSRDRRSTARRSRSARR